MDRQINLKSLLQQRELLLGCGIDSASTATAELAGLLGYDLVWADLEHGNVDLRQAEEFCRGAQCGGALPMLRLPGVDRAHILHALEAGARFVVIPMVESPETAAVAVRHAKYPPLGRRGFSGSTPGLCYGVGDRCETMRWADKETYLFVQIETEEAVRRCEEIVATEGVTGGLVGPADLSVSMGRPLAFEDPDFVKLFRLAIRRIRGQGKVAAAVTASPHLIEAGLEEGLQILICTGETSALRTYWGEVVRNISSLVDSCSRKRFSHGEAEEAIKVSSSR